MILGPGGRWPNSAGDLTIRLKSETVNFANLLRDVAAPHAQVENSAKTIEGLLLSEGAVNGWDQDATDMLIDQLHALVRKKFSSY